MRRLFKSLGLAAVCVTVALWSGAQEATNSKALIGFAERNFGVHFSHTTNISAIYNPHPADRVLLTYRNQTLGGLLICPAPPTERIKEWIDAGKAHYKKKWGASTVDYENYENPGKYRFHHLKAEVKQNDEDHVLVRYVYLREDPKPPIKPPDVGEKLIRSNSGAFSFEFIYLKKDQEQLKAEIKTIIDTFKIDDDYAWGTKGTQPTE